MPDYRLEKVEVGQLLFDPANPRLPPSVDGHDENAVLEWMLADSGLPELMGSMAQQGYFPGDPVLIVPEHESDDELEYDPEANYIVVEGNRRLAAIRLLRGDVTAPKRRKAVKQLIEDAKEHDFNVIPAVLFAHRSEVLDYLGFRHVTGVKNWDPLEKARFLEQLRDVDKGKPLTTSDLAKAIGSKASYVGRLLVALALLERLAESSEFADAGVEIDDVPFSLLVAALNHRAIAIDYLKLERADDLSLEGLNDEALEELGRWLFVKREDGKTALGDSRNLRLLGEVVASDKARDALAEGASITDAALIAHEPSDVISSALAQARNPLRVAEDQLGELDEVSADLADSSGDILETANQIDKAVRKAAKS